MLQTVAVKPELLVWARNRAGLDQNQIAKKINIKNVDKIKSWEQTGVLSLSQLQNFAKKTHTPLGYFFLQAPPHEELPIADFRSNKAYKGESSINLLDTVYICQRRQDWYRDYLVKTNANKLSFVGSVKMSDKPSVIANSIRKVLGIDDEVITGLKDQNQALSRLIAMVESIGVLVMGSGVVGNNNTRKLDVSEFRGFCLSDDYAPLIFLNGADSKNAQIFTLIHELAHIWLGQSGVSDVGILEASDIEIYCNQVAGEFLVPRNNILARIGTQTITSDLVKALSKYYKVSQAVILIRVYQLGQISREGFSAMYGGFHDMPASQKGARTSGGDFYRTQGRRLGKNFIGSVVISTLEGATTYSEAFGLLGIKKSSTFSRMKEEILGAV